MIKKLSDLLNEWKVYSDYDYLSGYEQPDVQDNTKVDTEYFRKNSGYLANTKAIENTKLMSSLTDTNVKRLISKYVDSSIKVAVIAVRAIGNDLKEKRGLYDDAFIVVDNTEGKRLYYLYPGNTDPSRYGESNLAKGKGFPVIQPGVYDYKPGIHNSRYPAFVQDSYITVKRDTLTGNEKDSVIETGDFGVNLHRGGRNKNEFKSDVSSSGCLTVPSEHWETFKNQLEFLVKKSSNRSFKLIVVKSNEL